MSVPGTGRILPTGLTPVQKYIYIDRVYLMKGVTVILYYMPERREGRRY
jgi:hypothetical protein